MIICVHNCILASAASAKACSINAIARPLAPVVDTATEAADTTVEAAAEVAAEVITKMTAQEASEETAERMTEGAIEKIVEKTAERATERAAEKAAEKITEKTTRSVMLLKIESELMILKIKMIDIDNIFDFKNPSLKSVKLAL